MQISSSQNMADRVNEIIERKAEGGPKVNLFANLDQRMAAAKSQPELPEDQQYSPVLLEKKLILCLRLCALLQGAIFFGDLFRFANGLTLILQPGVPAELAIILANTNLEFDGDAPSRQHFL